MTGSPKISVIVPVYNRAMLIQATLQSIQNQSYSNWECLVVDDNSTDGTWDAVAAWAHEDERIKALRKPSDHHRGPGAARNYGLKYSTGGIIHFLDSDDILKPNTYEEIAASFASNDIDYLITRLAFFESSIDRICKETAPYVVADFIVKGLMAEHAFYTPNVFWAKSFLNKTKVLFDENIIISEDLDFDIRNFVASDNFTIRNDLFVYIRQHGPSLSRSLSEIETKLELLYVLKSLVNLLRDQGLNNMLLARHAAYKSRRLLKELIVHHCYNRKMISYWVFMNRELMACLQWSNIFIYNAKMVYWMIYSWFNRAKEPGLSSRSAAQPPSS